MHGPHKSACFPSLDPLHYWVLRIVFKCFPIIRLLSYVSCREKSYSFVFLCHSFVAERSRGSCHHPSWCPGNRSPSCNTSTWTPCWWWKTHTAGLRGRRFCSAFCLCSAPSICSVCYAPSRLAMVVLVNIRRFSVGLAAFVFSLDFFLWRVVLACKTVFLASVVFLMVFSFWPYVFLKLVFMACVAFKLPFHRVCGFQTSFHGGHYPSFKFHSVLLSSCFHGVMHFQVVFRAWVMLKLVSLACVAFRLFSQSVWPSSWTFLACVTFILVSWCLSYFALHLVLWRVCLTICFHGVCCLQVVFMASAAVKWAHF